MGDLARRSTKSKFRGLPQHAPKEIQGRVRELLDSVVFIQDPWLRDVRFLGVVEGEGDPVSADFDSDGLSLYIGNSDPHAHLVWKWKGTLWDLPFSGTTESGGSGAHTHDDYALTDHTHDSAPGALRLDELQDTRITDPHDNHVLLYKSASKKWENKHASNLGPLISHTALQDIGSNTHPQIDTHISDATIHFTEASIDHGSIAGLGDDDHIQYLLRSEWLENGFDDSSDTALDWDDSTRTLTLSPAVSSFDYHYAGYMYNETGDLTATIPDTQGLWLFYIASGGASALSTIHSPTYEQVEDAILNECLVAYVYWDATANDGRLMDERHGSILGRGAHHYLHEIMGSQYLDGMTIGDVLVDQNGNLDSHAQFSMTAGEFYDEDIEHSLLARSSTDTWECYYVDGSGDVKWTNCEATFPVAAIGGVIAYNNAGTLTAVGNNKYICYHVFATNIHTDSGGDYYPVVTPGVAEYGSKALAQDAAASEIASIDFGDWPTDEIIPLWTVIYQHKGAMANGVEAATISTEGGGDAVDWRTTSISGSGISTNDHGALSGLGDDDHTQYLLASAATDRTTFSTNWTDLTDTGVTVLHYHNTIGDQPLVAPVPANGDILIYSTTGNRWVNTALYSLVYSETEVDNLLAGYLPLTGGTLTGDLVIEDGSSSDQHDFNSATGDVDLCQQAGQVTIGGTGGTRKLTVVDGAVGIDNGWKYTAKNNGGTYVDVMGVEAGGFRVLFGSNSARSKFRANDSCLYPVPSSAVSDANHDASYMTFWVDESGNTINFKVKYSGGTVKSGSVALA